MDFWPQLKEKTPRIIRTLASAAIIFFCLPWLMVLVILGTISQKELGLYDATQTYFNSTILWLGYIPTPGGLTTIGFIFIALSIKFLFFSKWNWAQSGIILSHLGILLLLIGGLLTAKFSYEGFMMIPEGKSSALISDYEKGSKKEETTKEKISLTLPFSIKLEDFRKIDYVGTNKARAFESDIIVEDNGVSWPVTISMNKPLRYKGYTFYQSSFDQQNGTEATILNVVKNAGRAFPYISSLVIFIGLLLHFLIRLRSGNKKVRT